MPEPQRRVVVLGASDNPERYSNMAVNRLLENGHEVIPVHPKLTEIRGLAVVPSPGDIEGSADTVTVYVSPRISSATTDDIIALRPTRVIFNPGAENAELEATLEERRIPTLRACTLVLLSTGQF